MDKLFKKIKMVPWWGWVSGIVFFILQRLFYDFGFYLSKSLGTISRAFECKIPVIDDLIPVIPVFTVIYLFSYIFWIMAPIVASLTEKNNYVNYLIGLFMAYLIGLLFFIFVPTYMDRVKEGLLVIVDKPGIFNLMLKTVYENDGKEIAYNLLPSYHCLISAYCYLGIRNREEISKGFRVYSLVMAILVCLSTIFTKQHYIIDVISGVGISLVCYIITTKLNIADKLLNREKR